MRKIDSFKDTSDALREVWDRLDNLSSQNIDMKKRRVVNATPSRDLYDYVVRKELKESENNVQQQVIQAATTGSIRKYTVVFSHGGFPAAEEFASPYFIVQKPGAVLVVKTTCLSPPIGVDAIFNVWYNGHLILSPGLHIPADSLAGVIYETTTFDPVNVQVVKDDLLCLNISQTGKVGKVTVEVWIEEK